MKIKRPQTAMPVLRAVIVWAADKLPCGWRLKIAMQAGMIPNLETTKKEAWPRKLVMTWMTGQLMDLAAQAKKTRGSLHRELQQGLQRRVPVPCPAPSRFNKPSIVMPRTLPTK